MKTPKESYTEKRIREDKAAKEKAFAHIPELLRQGLKTLVIKFDGEGDSGMIEEIYCSTDPAEEIDYYDNEGEAVGVLTEDARKAFEEYAYINLLPEGFEVGGGSYGIAKLDLTTRKTEIEITWRDVRYETETLHK